MDDKVVDLGMRRAVRDALKLADSVGAPFESGSLDGETWTERRCQVWHVMDGYDWPQQCEGDAGHAGDCGAHGVTWIPSKDPVGDLERLKAEIAETCKVMTRPMVRLVPSKDDG